MVGNHLFFGGVYRIRTYDQGVAVLCRTTWLTRHIALIKGYYSSHILHSQSFPVYFSLYNFPHAPNQPFATVKCIIVDAFF